MKEPTLATLNHLVLRAKQIKEFFDDFNAMDGYGISVCSLTGECIGGAPSIHVLSMSLPLLSKLANQPIAFKPLLHSQNTTRGGFTYSDVYFFSIFNENELEAYYANS